MTEFDPASRELCPDGACIGVIGPDGRCRECDRVAPSAVSDPRNRGLRAADSASPPERFAPDRELCPDGGCVGLIGSDDHCKVCGTPRAEPTSSPSSAPRDEDTTGSPGSDEADEFERRQLCPDGACIGVIGSGNRCKECGKSGVSNSS